MACIPRLLGPDLCYHVRSLCNNRAFRFQTDEDFARYVAIVLETREKFRFLFQHLALMHTHVHMILTTPGPVLLDRVMQQINRRYARDYHKRHRRSGHFWMHGYRAAVIDTDRYALACMRYGDRNAPGAGIVEQPADWQWCAYRFYAFGETTIPLDPHPSYLAIADDPLTRQTRYREFVETLLPSDEAREQEVIQRALQRHRARQSKPQK